jgi:trimeric autotransporter adhesin
MKAKAMYFFSFLVVFALVEVGFFVVASTVVGAGDSGLPESLAGAEKVVASSTETSETDDRNEVIEPTGTEGTNSTFYGALAGTGNTADYVTFIGAEAGASGNSGASNTFVGQRTGWKNTSGASNTFVGRNAGALNTEGNYNTFIGRAAGYSNTTQRFNTFVGYYAGYSTESTGFASGEQNTFIGYSAGRNTTTGAWNTFIGANAAYENTEGDFNVFVGHRAGGDNTRGDNNIFIGSSAGRKNIYGDHNIFIGVSAGANTTTSEGETGGNNVFVGYAAGSQNITGSGNVFVGYRAGRNEMSSDKLYINNSDSDNPLIWGDFNTKNVVIHGGFRSIASYSSSDKRLKKNIRPLESSLDKISFLQGVTYEWKVEKYPDFGLTEGKQIGLVAQDVEKELPELVSEDKDGYKAVSYTKLTAVLVEAVKELKTENQRQKKLIVEQRSQFEKQLEKQRNQFRKQQTEIEELRSMIRALKG